MKTPKTLKDLDAMDSMLDQMFSDDKAVRQGSKLVGRKRQDHSEFMTKNNPMAGLVSPNRGKAMPEITQKNTGLKRSEKTKQKISETRLRLGLGNTWTGKIRPEQSEAMRDPHRNKGAETMRLTETCPYCGKVANIPNYTRWHGDNCKHK